MKIFRDTHPAPVLGIYVHPYAQQYYRLAIPLRAAYGAENVAVTAYDSISAEQRQAARLVVTSRLQTLDTQPATMAYQLAHEIKEQGKRRLLIDIDDDLSPWPGLGRERIMALARASDGIVCTNSLLAGRLRSLNRNVTIVSNYIDMATWPIAPITPPADVPTILITGSPSHEQDWREALPALQQLRGRYRLKVVGFLPNYLKPYADEYVPWTLELSDYPTLIRGAHIALCPLPRTAFNRCKSPIKAYETSLAGCAVIGSETQYGDVLRAAGLSHRVVGLNNPWAAILSDYLEHPEQVQRDAHVLRSYVMTAIDVSRHAEHIREAYGGYDVLDNGNTDRRVEHHPIQPGRRNHRIARNGGSGSVRHGV